MAKTTPSPLHEAIKRQIQDERNGIAPGPKFGDQPFPEAEPIPDIRELGVPLSVRKKLEALCAHQAELGSIQHQAEKDRETVTAEIKALLAEHVADDVPAFQVGECRVARYTQNRSSFSKDVMRDQLLSLGVKATIVVKAMEAATSTKPVVSLKITGPREEA